MKRMSGLFGKKHRKSSSASTDSRKQSAPKISEPTSTSTEQASTPTEPAASAASTTAIAPTSIAPTSTTEAPAASTASEMSATDHGKCHCGQVEWDVKLTDRSHILCHCDTCKVLSGGTFTCNQIIPRSDIKITKGKLNDYTYYGDSGKAVHCYYCPNCTTHVYHHQEVMGPDTIVARTIVLENGKSIQPGAEIYGKARLPWEKELATTFDTLPPS